MQKLFAIVLVLSGLTLGWVSSVGAATATHFSCDSILKECSCNPDIDGDCDAMKINCEDGKIASCVTISDFRRCQCTMGRAGVLKDKLKGKLDKNLPVLVPQ